ncbi:MAG: hypothetical protein RIB79_01175 [Allomuricauda sp.]|jgi:hypothetical protein
MRNYLVLLFLFSGLCSWSQEILDLSYNSVFEEEQFGQYSKDEIGGEYVKALLAIDSTMTDVQSENIKKEIDDYLSGLKTKTDRYSPKKKVKYIFNKVHDRFFRKYELDAYFPDIFESATYNCVSGTALYAYAFDFFGVPYQIKETPTHVFLVAYPQDYNILVETTLPGKAGSYVPSETIMKRAVDELVDLKIYTAEQVSSIGYNRAYNDYYYGNENITKKDLVGIQYYNKGIIFLNDSKFELAYDNMLKSSVIYKNKKTEIFNEGILSLLMDQVDFSDIENFKWLVSYAKISDDTDYLKYKLHNILSNGNWEEDNLGFVESKLDTIKDLDLRNQLLVVLYSYRAERAHKYQRTSEALTYAEKIYEISPEDIDAKNYIALAEIEKMALKNVSAIRLVELDELLDKYPFLEEFGIYQRYQVYLYSFLAANGFHNNKKDAAQEYLLQLEGILGGENQESTDFDHRAIGEAYGEAGAYFYRNGQKENAINILKRGMKFSPENENIKRKIRLIKKSY